MVVSFLVRSFGTEIFEGSPDPMVMHHDAQTIADFDAREDDADPRITGGLLAANSSTSIRCPTIPHY
jgi:hypothetical protein